MQVEHREEARKLTVEDWLEAGYNRFDQVTHIKKYASFGLQKCIRDDLGKKYFITVYVYKMYDPNYGTITSFAPDAQFLNDESYAVNTEIIMHSSTSIQDVEDVIEKLWIAVGQPYYSLW
jgi:hypothetical protein